jgi:hypothetical protein
MLNVLMLNAIMLIVLMLNIAMLKVLMFNVIMPNVLMYNIVMLNVMMFNVIMMNVVAPFEKRTVQILKSQASTPLLADAIKLFVLACNFKISTVHFAKGASTFSITTFNISGHSA